MDFKSKTVLITGGAKGLGFETAKLFHKEGAKVILIDNDESALKVATGEMLGSLGVVVDLLDWNKTRQAVEKLVEENGTIHHLVNNAGVLVLGKFMEAEENMVDKTFGINFKAVINISQIIACKMQETETGGTIVNVSSIGSQRPLPQSSIYCASKSALKMITECMAIELGPKVQVNCVCPGLMDTSLVKQCREEYPGGWKRHISRTPMDRLVELREAAEAIVYLSSQKSSMITGVSINVDGGYLLT